jgi:hypothetical protein
MNEILIAILSSLTTIVCVVLQKKMKTAGNKKTIIDLLSDPNVQEVKLEIKNKDNDKNEICAKVIAGNTRESKNSIDIEKSQEILERIVNG